jgi:hypothetical protein
VKRKRLIDSIKFDDCLSCRHFLSDDCVHCDSGELFQLDPDVDDAEPTDNELMASLRDDDDE